MTAVLCTCALTRMSPLDGQRRCVHDMLPGQCSWCKGLPDVPFVDLAAAAHVDDEPTVGLRWVICESREDCARCGNPIRLGKPAAYSTADGGLVGECCEDPE